MTVLLLICLVVSVFISFPDVSSRSLERAGLWIVTELKGFMNAVASGDVPFWQIGIVATTIVVTVARTQEPSQLNGDNRETFVLLGYTDPVVTSEVSGSVRVQTRLFGGGMESECGERLAALKFMIEK